MLSARQIRAARGLLGWSRRELAIISRVSEGTIKAIEQGKNDARVSTLRKLAQTFTAHSVVFITEGSGSGVMINKADDLPAPPDSRDNRSGTSVEPSNFQKEVDQSKPPSAKWTSRWLRVAKSGT